MDKKYIPLILVIILTILVGCRTTSVKKEIYTDTIGRFTTGNEKYITATYNSGNISGEKRQETATNGQFPYAIVITCSDSRVVPEHIFNAGIGELFVIRTAGNVIAEFELGSYRIWCRTLECRHYISYGAYWLWCKGSNKFY